MAHAGAVERRESTPSGASSRATNAWARSQGAASRRRTTVMLDGPAPKQSVSIYDKQLMWKHHGQRKREQKTLELLNQENVECTFAPKTNRTPQIRRPTTHAAAVTSPVRPGQSDRENWDGSSQYSESPRTVRSVDLSDVRHQDDELAGSEDEEVPMAMALHPTEPQEGSILLHLARQERAREEAQNAQRKLESIQPRKDFTKVTTPRPFELSVTNRKARRSTSGSPNDRSSRPRSRSSIDGMSTRRNSGAVPSRNHSTAQRFLKRRSHESAGGEDDTQREGGSDGSVADESTARQCDALIHPWEEERKALLATIETQRQALEERERAQQDAARLAETFAAAVQTFEARIESVETTSATELSEMKRLLARQTAAIDLLLHALGLESANTHAATPASPPQSNPASRREAK